MNAAFLLVPFLLIRYGLMGILDKTALKRAAFFAPLVGKERAALAVYQVGSVGLFVYPFFLKISYGGALFYTGLFIYTLGCGITAISAVNFARPSEGGINRNGIYRISRNPMYIGYFFCFLGCALLTRSVVLLCTLAVFQAASHWIILAEERWCIQEFGEEYERYRRTVRRYL